MINSVVLLHNFGASLVGLNQITDVFSSKSGEYINLEGYDRLRKYFPDVDKEWLYISIIMNIVIWIRGIVTYS